MTDQQILRGFLANPEVIPPLIFTFPFNPASLSDNKSVRYTDRESDLSGSAPGKVYTGGGHRLLSFRFELHGLESGGSSPSPTAFDSGIAPELAKLRSFLYPKEDAWAVFGASEEGRRLTAPPTCFFGFGARLLECIVTDMAIQETQFNSLLAPVRAEVNITLAVIEEGGSGLYELDRQRRNLLAATGIQRINLF